MNVYILKSSCGEFIKIGKANDVSNRIKQIGEKRFNLHESFYIPCETEKKAFKLERSLHKIYSFAKYHSLEWFDGATELFDIKILPSVTSLVKEFPEITGETIQLAYNPRIYHTKAKKYGYVPKGISEDKRNMFVLYVSYLLNDAFKLSHINIIPDFCYKELRLKKTGELIKYVDYTLLHDNLLSVDGKRLFGTSKGHWMTDSVLTHIVANSEYGNGVLLGSPNPTGSASRIHLAFRRYLNVHSHEQLVHSYNITTGFCEPIILKELDNTDKLL